MLNRLGVKQARTVTLSVTGLLLVILVALLVLLPVPYARLSPGPATDVLGEAGGEQLIVISGTTTFPDTGKLDLTTVAVSSPGHEMSLLEAMSGWLQSGVAVVPRETIYPDDVSAEAIEARNVEEMELSQKHATAAALKQLNVEIESNVVVARLIEGTPAFEPLAAGDRILKIDGVKVTTPADVVDLVRKHEPDEKVTFTILRAGVRSTATLITTVNPDDATLPFVGIEPGIDYEFPFQVEISLEDVGGPSAGLMFALGIIERLTAEAITAGRHIAGTGTITDDGVVGKIGGIQMKILGAERAGADVFLVPAENCREATADPPEGITLVKVGTLADAVSALTALRTGSGAVPAC